MPTFVVRLLGATLDTFQGRVRHVATGEETSFSTPNELVAFMEGVTGASGLSAAMTGLDDRESSTVARHPAQNDTDQPSKGKGRKRGADASSSSAH